VKGNTTEFPIKALIDTGAEISFLPIEIARHIGAWKTREEMDIIGVHKDVKKYPLVIAEVFFPSLNLIGGKFRWAMSDVSNEPIIGMDILKPLGITINSKNGILSIKNELWEAFKTLTAVGVIMYGAVKILGSLAEEENN